MALSKDMVSDTIDISKLINSENLSQPPRKPTKEDTAKYNSVIKPELVSFADQYKKTPPRILKALLDEYITKNNLANAFEAQGLPYWG